MQHLNRVQALLRPLEQFSQHQNKWLDYDFPLIGISQRFPRQGSDDPISMHRHLRGIPPNSLVPQADGEQIWL